MAKLFLQENKGLNRLTLQQLTIPYIICGKSYRYQLNYMWRNPKSPTGGVLGSENKYYNRKELPIQQLLDGKSLFDVFQLFC